MALERDAIRNLMRNLERYSELSIRAVKNDQTFAVHRHIIAESSNYFYEKLTENVDQLHLTDIDGSILEEIIHFIYIEYIDLNEDNIEGIMCAATTMVLVSLKERCELYLDENLTDENCLKYLLLVDLCEVRGRATRARALSLVCANFKDKCLDSAFKRIEGNTLIQILRNDDLGVNEIDIFDCMVGWVQHDLAERTGFVGELLRLIRLDRLLGEHLRTRVGSFFREHHCFPLILEEYERRMENYDPKWQKRTPECLHIHYAECIRNVGILIYRFRKAPAVLWESREFLQHNFSETNELGWACRADKLYIFDGSLVHCIKLTNNAQKGRVCFNFLSAMRSRRANFAAIPFGIHLYVFGDPLVDGNYRFHTEQNTWEDMPPVPGNLSNYCEMEMDGNIYIAGEYDQSPQAEHHESMVAIYRYSIMRREWKELPTRLANFQIASMTKSSDRRIILILKDLENLWVYRYNPVAGNSECDWVGKFAAMTRIMRTIHFSGEVYALYQEGESDTVMFGRIIFDAECTFADALATHFQTEKIGQLYIN